MNHQRLETLLTIMQEVKAGTWNPSVEKVGVGKWLEYNGQPAGFNIVTWGEPVVEEETGEPCGFTACVIGHAAMDDRCPWVEVDEEVDDPYEIHLWFPEDPDQVFEEDSLVEALNLAYDDVSYLFMPSTYSGHQNNVDEVIKRIEEYL